MKYFKYIFLALTLIFGISLFLKEMDFIGMSGYRGYETQFLPVVIIAMIVIVNGSFSKPAGDIRIAVSALVLIMTKVADYIMAIYFIDAVDASNFFGFLVYVCPGAWNGIAAATMMIVCGIWCCINDKKQKNVNVSTVGVFLNG